jgi:hypothetical protein
MKCGYSREILALYIEDDLPAPEAQESVRQHVRECAECEQYCLQLQTSQSLIKSGLRSSGQDAMTAETLAAVRHGVMSQIDGAHRRLGWALALERLLLLGFRRQRYAAAGFAIVAVVSASLLGQIQHTQKQPRVAGAVFVGKNRLVRPAAYREWVFVGSSLGLGYTPQSETSEMYHNVYINPEAYREYSKSGRFPEGTVMVMEMISADLKKEPGLHGSYEKDFMAVEASVKDSRFEGGWGYFDFSEGMGTLKAEAEPLPQTAGCLSCHQERAATDHVFTQFYPVLRLGKT